MSSIGYAIGLSTLLEVEAFADYLDGTRFTVHQVRFATLIVDELTANGVVEAGRLFESPYTDTAATGPDGVFSEHDLDGIVAILRTVKQHALPVSDVS